LALVSAAVGHVGSDATDDGMKDMPSAEREGEDLNADASRSADGSQTSVGSYQEMPMPPVIMGTYQVATPAELKAEILAAEQALSVRAVVDGPAVVYDSPSVSIAVRKVSNEALAKNVTKIDAPDGAGITVPQGVQGKSGKPVTITVTSYHASEKIMKAMPSDLRVRFEKERRERQASGIEPSAETGGSGDDASAAAGEAGSEPAKAANVESSKRHTEHNSTDQGVGENPKGASARAEPPKPDVDRVDFFTTKTSVSWVGNVNVKYAGLSATVPAHDRTPGKGPAGATFGGEEEVLFAAEKEQIYKEVESLASLPEVEMSRGFRQLARKWHPDKNPDDAERATEVFNYLQELKSDVLRDGDRSTGYRVLKPEHR